MEENYEDTPECILKEMEEISNIPIPSWKISLLMVLSKILNVKIQHSYPYRWKYKGVDYSQWS